MGHEGHEHQGHSLLGLFASPINTHGHGHGHGHAKAHSSASEESSLKQVRPADAEEVPYENMDCELHDNPAYHHHAEATTAELFYDLFFVANLTTFTGLLEINDKNSLTAYIGFFSLLWLTWYQVSLYDVRFSADSVFERVAKALHFGVMVGFAVIGPQWKPGQEENDFKIFKAFGYILMVSRFTLVAQYSVTLFYSKKYSKTVVPLVAIILSTLVAGILYGALTPIFPSNKADEFGVLIYQKSDAYIAWYVIGLSETIITVAVSCIWRVVSFKGTHMVQRMSLLTLIILGEGIIVVCKSISKIIKNDYLWTAAVVGQVIASILIIYFLYMLYFDRIQEEHFGTIKQQVWSFLHFPLHTSIVLVLQGVSLFIIWLQAIRSLDEFGLMMADVAIKGGNLEYADGTTFASEWNYTMAYVYDFVPKGTDASKAFKTNEEAFDIIVDAYDSIIVDPTNTTAGEYLSIALTESMGAAVKTLFDSLSISVPKKKKTKEEQTQMIDVEKLLGEYVDVFELVFTYVFVAVSLFSRKAI
jgi:low temperature requirement protein LtrA